MRIELINIYHGKPYYGIIENGQQSFALGFEQARKYVKRDVVLADSLIIKEHSKLIKLVLMTQLRNLLIKLVEAKK